MGICTISSFVLYRINKKKRYILVCLFFLSYSFLTYTRAVWFGLLCVFIFYLLSRKKWIKLSLFLIIFLLVFVIFLKPLFFLEYNQSNNFWEEFTQGRNVIWNTFFDMFKEKPIFGLGFEYTTKYSQEYTGIWANHSDPLKVLFELGIIGFSIYLFYVIFQFKSLLKLKYPYDLIILFFIFYLITSFFGNVFNYVQLIGIQVFTLVGLGMNNKNENTTD
jgi:O-antigen ligase